MKAKVRKQMQLERIEKQLKQEAEDRKNGKPILPSSNDGGFSLTARTIDDDGLTWE